MGDLVRSGRYGLRESPEPTRRLFQLYRVPSKKSRGTLDRVAVDDNGMANGEAGEAGDGDIRDDSSSSSLEESGESDPDDPLYCRFCGSGADFHELIQCSFCFHWVHMDCFNERCDPELILHEVPEGFFQCGTDCRDKYMAAVRSNKQKDVLDLLGGGADELENSDTGTIREDAFDGFGGHRVSLPADTALAWASRGCMQIWHDNPMHVASVDNYIRTNSALHPTTHSLSVKGMSRVLERAGCPFTPEQLQVLQSAAPPLSIRRSLLKCSDGRIREETLSHHVRSAGVVVTFRFFFRCPVEAAADLLDSNVLRSKGPMWDPSQERCSTGRMPDLDAKIKGFEGYANADEAERLTIPVGFYFDESASASRNVEFYPVWETNLLIDPDVRFVHGKQAHALIAFLPVKSALIYAFDEHTKGSPEQAASKLSKGQVDRALQALQQKAVARLLQCVTDAEADGLRLNVRGRERVIRLMIAWVSTDMKERRRLLGLRKGVYDCSHCYAFPGRSNPEESWRKLRTSAEDARIRSDAAQGFERLTEDGGRASLSRDQQFKRDFGHLGIELLDDCVFSNQGADHSVYMRDGPYELFPFDALHNKDGVVRYFMRFLMARMGDGFIELTKRFGNVFLETSRHAMHISEAGIEGFHSVPLAILFSPLSVTELPDDERQMLFRASCDLILILTLLVDPCPAFVSDTLRETIQRFITSVEVLLGILAGQGFDADAMEKFVVEGDGGDAETDGDEDVEDGEETGAQEATTDSKVVKNGKKKATRTYKLTTKMHELAHHVVDHIKRLGLPSGFSAKLFETFHEPIKSGFINSSKRFSKGQAWREIILSFFLEAVIDEASNETQIARAIFADQFKDWKPELRTVIRNNRPAKDLPAMILKDNWNIASTVLFSGGAPVPSVQPFEADAVGSTCEMWVHCAARDVRASHSALAVVPGTSKGKFYHGGNFNLLVYRDGSATLDRTFTECKNAECTSRHHDPSFELFCSSVRDQNSAFGVPLLFSEVRGTRYAVVWPMEALPSSEALLPSHPSLFEARCQFRLKLVRLSRVRGVCMFRPCDTRRHSGVGYVWPGRNVFGYNVEN